MLREIIYYNKYRIKYIAYFLANKNSRPVGKIYYDSQHGVTTTNRK